jgi:ABC-type glycerol-3-phosphate transport system permease component
MANEKQHFFEASQELLEDYVKNRLLLLKLQAAEKSARLVSLLFTGLIIALLSFFVLLFLSIMAGYFFAQLTGSMFYGFGIVALSYVILLVLVLYLRKGWITRYISGIVVGVFFDANEKEEADHE